MTQSLSVLRAFTGLGSPYPGVVVDCLQHLVRLEDEQLACIDVGLLNLLCAVGLPGATGIDIDRFDQQLNAWANVVRDETTRGRVNFRPNPSCPTESYYRCFMLIKVLRDRFNLKHYLLPEKGTGLNGVYADGCNGVQVRFDDAKLLFIHGLLSDERIGSCSSLPVLGAAVGRRLGYPIKLVLAVQHLFIRWQDDSETFNMEGSGPDFITSPPDEHYVDIPRPWTHQEKTSGALLSSLTPRQELAAFLYMRYGCLQAHEQWEQCQAVLVAVCKLHAENPHYQQSRQWVESKLAAKSA